jgi:putative glutamine amidotransferase
VVGRPLRAGRVQGWRDAALAVPRAYLDALKRAGARGAVLAPTELSEAEAVDCLSGFAGLLLTGGGDIDPARYGATVQPEVYGIDADADAFELALLDAAEGQRLPVLGICRGLQVLNVAHGGTLDQHITDRPGLEAHGVPGVAGSLHPVFVEPGSKLADVLGETKVMASCHHHQAVAEVGRDLQVTARSADGVVEGLELDRDGWVVAVQWHPEDTVESDAAQQGLFDGFVERCRGAYHSR